MQFSQILHINQELQRKKNWHVFKVCILGQQVVFVWELIQSWCGLQPSARDGGAMRRPSGDT